MNRWVIPWGVVVVGMLVAATSLLPGPPRPTGLTGTWVFDVVLDTGGGDVTFVLRQDGETLSGTYDGAYGTAELQGTVRDERIEFTFETKRTGTVTFKGRLDGSSMNGTCDYSELSEGTWVAMRRGARPFWQ